MPTSRQRELVRIRNVRYRERHRERVAAQQRAYVLAHPEKIAEFKSRCAGSPKELARQMVRNHVARGTMVKPDHCEDCGNSCNPHGHHEDYSKPLSVSWLCSQCHGKRHRR
jgi:hypothetical protein